MVHVPALQRRGGGLGPPREAPATPSRHVNNGRTVEGGIPQRLQQHMRE